MNAKLTDEPKDFLIGIYERLRQHEEMLIDLKVLVESAIATLKDRDRPVAEVLSAYQASAHDQARPTLDVLLGQYDELIARLRRA